MQQSARGKTYTMKTLLGVLGISRNTLRYYESIGVVSPVRDPESNYRFYTNDDVFSVSQLNVLKNVGFEVADAQVLMERIGDPAEFLERASAENERQLVWHKAVQNSLETIRDIDREVEEGPVPKLVQARPCLIFHDECETGYDRHVADPAQNALIRSMPVATFGSVIEGDFFAEELSLPRWGRVVYEEHASLLPELAMSKAEPRRVGGCPCVEMSYAEDTDKVPGFDEDGAIRRAIKSFIAENDLEQDGPAYTSHALPVQGTFYARIHLPVRARGFLARRKLAKLEQR